nr:alpha/beta hydrolase [Amycolatopsis suaedae]
MKTKRRAAVGALTAALAVVGLPATVGTAAAEPAVRAADVAATTPIKWNACPQGTLPPSLPPEQAKQYSCAYYRVPIDHDNAALGTIDIALLRRAAAKPDTKIGSLFLNPGGPGGSGYTMPVGAHNIFNADVLDRFDIIGFDPRGVGRSNPLRCFTTAEDYDEVFARQVNVPLSRTEISDSLTAFRDYGDFCKRNAGTLLNHMSTKDVVRDLDVLRAAAGDAKLNFVGFSYGTLIGSTYANMFPRNARALVLDGNVDPELRTRDGLQYDRERARGFETSLTGFLTECTAAGPRCAFSPGQPRQKFDELRDHLRKQPITLPGGGSVTIHSFTGGVSRTLYNPAGFPSLAEQLQELYEVLHPSSAPAAKSKVAAADVSVLSGQTRFQRYDVEPDTPYTSDDSYFAVNCSDKLFRHRQERLPAIAAQWERESPTFGRSQAFSDAAACPVWPGKEDVYRGPWNAETENPVIVIGNYYDPATQYEFSRRMASQLGNARLVSVDAHGHCILGDSKPVDDLTAAYLINLTAPAPGQVYKPDAAPFGSPA